MLVIDTIRNGYKNTEQLNGVPEECPHCHHKITPIPIIATSRVDAKRETSAVLQCPNKSCSNLFIALYLLGQFKRIISIQNKTHTFSDTINQISPKFVSIYNEAYQAEQYGLNEICGVGYRKSFEFLIKDFLSQIEPDSVEKFQRITLGQCIKNHIKEKRIQDIAERAVWLGNDETHYIRKWNDKDLNDLKTLMKVSLHFIEMEILANEALVSMPK
jgi:hypothetical protein